MNYRSTLGAKISAVLCIFLAAPATFGLMIAMNKLTSCMEEEKGPKVVEFTIEEPKKKKKKQNPRQVEIQQRSSARSTQNRALAPLPDLGTGVSGIQIAMPGYEGAGLSSVSDSVLGNLDNVVMTEETVDNRPVAKIAPYPTFPPRAHQKNIEGRVVLNVLIGKDGRVKKIKILEVDPRGYKFEQAAVNAVRNWMFEPATYKKRPVKMWATLPINFALK